MLIHKCNVSDYLARSGNRFAFQTIASLGLYALAPVMPRLAVTGFTFAQSFLATALLKYLDSKEPTPTSHGYGLLGACVFVYIGIAVVQSRTHIICASQLTSQGFEQLILAPYLQVCLHYPRRLDYINL